MAAAPEHLGANFVKHYQAFITGFATESSAKSRREQNKHQLCSSTLLNESEKDSGRRKRAVLQQQLSPGCPAACFLTSTRDIRLGAGAGILPAIASAFAPCHQPLLWAALFIKGISELGPVNSKNICYA